MKPVFLLFINVLFIINGWFEFTSVEGRFRILTPEELVQKQDTVSTVVGKLVYHTFFYQPKDKDAENLFYMVSYCDYPEGVLLADSTDFVQEFFETTMDAAASSVKGKLLYSTDIQLDTHPGKLWRIDYLDGKAVIKTKAYLVGRRYYAIQTISWQQANINPSADKFFDSFRLL